jgi:antitoxin component YwqK of YwqJK toxin-antitoxin module
MKLIQILQSFLVVINFVSGVCVGDESDFGQKSEKVGPVATRDPDVVKFYFYQIGKPRESVFKVGEETVSGGVLTERRRFRDGVLHGMQEFWDRDGGLRREDVYENGLMSGLFRRWDERGQLVARFLMADGSGDLVCFNSKGYLREVSHYSGGKKVGYETTFDRSGKVASISKLKDGKFFVGSFGFRQGKLTYFIPYDDEGLTDGAYLKEANGDVSFRFFIGGVEVNREEFIERRRRDEQVVDIPSSLEDCRRFLPKDFADFIAAIEKVRPIPIPLRLNADGKVLDSDGRVLILPNGV